MLASTRGAVPLLYTRHHLLSILPAIASTTRASVITLQSRHLSRSASNKRRREIKCAAPPINSMLPDIAAAQARIFGNVDSYANEQTGRKMMRPSTLADRLLEWYPPSEDELRRAQLREIKHLMKVKEQENRPRQEINHLRSLMEMMRFSPKQDRKAVKMARLLRRGKVPAKKGFGKRSGKKKK